MALSVHSFPRAPALPAGSSIDKPFQGSQARNVLPSDGKKSKNNARYARGREVTEPVLVPFELLTRCKVDIKDSTCTPSDISRAVYNLVDNFVESSVRMRVAYGKKVWSN